VLRALWDVALDDLKLRQLLVVYAGDRSYQLDEGFFVVPLERLRDGLSPRP